MADPAIPRPASRRMPLRMLLTGPIMSLVAFAAAAPTGEWSTMAPREEIRPSFSRQADALIITHDQRAGLDGWYQQTFAVRGGDFMKFRAVRKTAGVANPRHSGLVRIVWSGPDGKAVPSAIAGAGAEPEHPPEGAPDEQGRSVLTGVYQVPPKATQATIELHLQHAPGGRAEWSDILFEKSAAPAPRWARLATVQYVPTGKSPRQNCEEYAPLIAEAAGRQADLIVLGETVPYVRTGLTPAQTSEPVPGPTTAYFGDLAKRYSLHVALSLYERDGHLIYNTAVLLGPAGQLIGKYRKVCLPHGEVEKGVAPGADYPVFDTRFGKVGLMICYDGFFPEVARALTANGAEVIAWPVWGCDPLLARARACENRVYVVSSTFTDPKQDWMISAVIDPAGKIAAQAKQNGSVVVHEVDLAKPMVGPYNLGDFHGMVQRHRPEAPR